MSASQAVATFFQALIAFLGRALIGWFFISEAYHRILEWDTIQILIEMKHVPFAQSLLSLAVFAMILGGVLLIAGFQTRIGALILTVCTGAWIGVMHDFWTLHSASERASDYQIFALGLAIIGGLFTLVAFGGGRFSIDSRGERG